MPKTIGTIPAQARATNPRRRCVVISREVPAAHRAHCGDSLYDNETHRLGARLIEARLQAKQIIIGRIMAAGSVHDGVIMFDTCHVAAAVEIIKQTLGISLMIGARIAWYDEDEDILRDVHNLSSSKPLLLAEVKQRIEAYAQKDESMFARAQKRGSEYHLSGQVTDEEDQAHLEWLKKEMAPFFP